MVSKRPPCRAELAPQATPAAAPTTFFPPLKVRGKGKAPAVGRDAQIMHIKVDMNSRFLRKWNGEADDRDFGRRVAEVGDDEWKRREKCEGHDAHD